MVAPFVDYVTGLLLASIGILWTRVAPSLLSSESGHRCTRPWFQCCVFSMLVFSWGCGMAFCCSKGFFNAGISNKQSYADCNLKSFFLRSYTWRNWRVRGSKWPPQLRGWVGRAKRLTDETWGKSMFPQSVKLWYSEMTCYSLFGWGIQSTLVSCLEWSCLWSQRVPSEMQPL